MTLLVGRVVCFARPLPRALSAAAASNTAKLKEKTAPSKKIQPKEVSKPENIVIRWPRNEKSAAFLCWHPEPQHPYEHTLLLQHDKKALQMGDSVVRQEYVAQATADHVRRVTRSHGPNWKTLGKAFNDDWHQFRPKPRQSATKDTLPVPPPEREGELPR